MISPIRLSICIPTMNRGAFIGETLESIVRQMTPQVEIVIVDGGSSDNTAEIVAEFGAHHERIRYIRTNKPSASPSNEGFDRDCNLAVERAEGDYCWLMTDDDLLIDGAVAEVLRHLEAGPELVVGCVRIHDVDLSHVLVEQDPAVSADRSYTSATWSDFVTDVAPHLTFVGRVVIKRSVWLSRDRERHFGSGFIHAGVILSCPLASAVMVARPLVALRYGNALWTSRAFDIWMFQWPDLIWATAGVSDAVKASVTQRRPYENLKRLLWYRALGSYSIRSYRDRLAKASDLPYRVAAMAIARLPVRLVNGFFWTRLISVRDREVATALYDLLHCGKAPPFVARLARRRGIV